MLQLVEMHCFTVYPPTKCSRMQWLVCRLLLVASTVLAAKVRAVCVIYVDI
jgi:hypothetical protein